MRLQGRFSCADQRQSAGRALVGFVATATATATIALAGCGGGDDATTIATTNTVATTTQSGPSRPKAQKEAEHAGQAPRKKQAEQDGSNSGEHTTIPFREPTGPAPTTTRSLPNEGTKKAAPGVPLVPASKNGDNSVQTYGVEAPSADRIEAARLVQAFVNARLNHEWELACSYLSNQVKLQMQALVSQPGQKEDLESACLAVMKTFAANVPQETLRTAADINVLSMRVGGDSAIVIYRDGEGTPSTIPMSREDGVWKVSAAAGSLLFLGP